MRFKWNRELQQGGAAFLAEMLSVGGSADLLLYHRMLCSEEGFKECLIIEASTSEDEDLPDVRY